MRVSEAKLLSEICRESYADFVKAFWPVLNKGRPLVWNWHVQLMCDEVQAVCGRIFRGEPKEYDPVWNVPPGSTKSTVWSIMLCPWAWTRMPEFCFLGASHGHPLAVDLSMKSRDVVKSELYHTLFPEVAIRKDLDMKAEFKTVQGGVRNAVGVNGTITGKHYDLISVDDPIDPMKVLSDAELFAANHWCSHTLSSRKKDEVVSVMALIMQRLHQDDPTAQKVREGGNRHVVLPATTQYEVKPPEYADYYVNGLLDPVRLPPEVLAQKMKVLLEYGFAGQYGQNPVPAGGGMFRTMHLRWGAVPNQFRRVVRFWDKAATGVAAASRTSRASWTTGVKMGEDDDERYWVLDVVRVRVDTFTRERLIRRTAMRDGPGVVVGIEQEPGSGGKDSAVGTVRRLAGYRTHILTARGSKEVRAEEFSVQVNAGNVFLPEKFREGNGWAGWVRDYVDELMHWPHSTYMDQGDASGGAYSLLASGHRRAGVLPERLPGRRRVGI